MNKHDKIRKPAVAGLFYPSDQAELNLMLDKYLTDAMSLNIPGIRAIICPHAGYIYSGPVAAKAYKQLTGRKIDTVIILAPSHYAMFGGASVSDAAFWETPLGKIAVSDKARDLSMIKPFIPETPCEMAPPSWSIQSPLLKNNPKDIVNTPHTWEHSIEVQIPFIQKVLPQAKIIPVVMDNIDYTAAAKALNSFLTENTVIVVSSDLSHYNPYDLAKKLDKETIEAICNFDYSKITPDEACGCVPIKLLLKLAELNGWKARMIAYQNSGDTAGDKQRVVGYTAIVFYEDIASELNSEDKRYLLKLARQTIASAFGGKKIEDVLADQNPGKNLTQARGCFVTITEGGKLRGCIGNIWPSHPLFKAVAINAFQAAFKDFRFPPLQPNELPHIELEVSVLTVPKPLNATGPKEILDKLNPGKDGVVLQIDTSMATFLPQVWEQIPGKIEFLEELSKKAGCPPDAWKNNNARVLIYHVVAFKESEFGLTKN